MTPAAGINSTSSKQSVEGRAMQAGRQFEALLLNMVLGETEKSFSQLPGSKVEQATESYRSLGMQALTGKLAREGGIGIARVIAQALLKTEVRTKV